MMTSPERHRRERFEALFERCHPEVRAYVLRRAPQAIVEDVVSETFLVAWRTLDSVPGEPLPWLYGGGAPHPRQPPPRTPALGGAQRAADTHAHFAP